MAKVQNSLVKNNQQQKPSLSAYLQRDAVKQKINEVVGGKDGQRFISAIVSATNTNTALQECNQGSIVSAALLGEALKLSPSPQLGHYYLVPYKDKEKGNVAQFQLGYKGYIQLAIRSGQYKKLNVIAVKEGELVRFNPLDEEIEINLNPDWDARENLETIGYYAMFELVNGFRKAIYWSKKQMHNHALKYSQGYRAKKGFTFWEKNFDMMAYKTMLRQLISKWGIMSIEMQSAFEHDMTFTDDSGKVNYVETDDDVIDYEPVEHTEEVQEEKTEYSVNEQATGAAAALFGK